MLTDLSDRTINALPALLIIDDQAVDPASHEFDISRDKIDYAVTLTKDEYRAIVMEFKEDKTELVVTGGGPQLPSALLVSRICEVYIAKALRIIQSPEFRQRLAGRPRVKRQWFMTPNVTDPCALLLSEIHGIGMAPMPEGAQILLSETLFDEVDRQHLRGLLGEDSPVRIAPAKEIRDASTNRNTTKQNLACVISKADYDNADLWDGNHKDKNKATMLILGEDLRSYRYLYIEGVVGLARAMMVNDTAAMGRYLERLFVKSANIDDAGLLNILLNEPERFSEYIKFKRIEPYDTEELPEKYKCIVESYLIAA
jgi:hypothetical protein